MIMIEDIKDLVSNEMLNDLFDKRNEDLNMMTQEERERQKKFIGDENISYDDVLIAIKDSCKEDNNNITTVLEKYLEKLLNLQTYDNERFYKVGFCDALNYILSAKNFKR